MKDSVRRVKRQTPDWEPIFAKHVSDKDFVSRTYQGLSKLNEE